MSRCRQEKGGALSREGRGGTVLPTKVCPVCRRPFAWRKKWEKVWEQVVYCSEACKRKRGRP
ncbi:MAG: DUF2256 domain-containing protein [Isosphaeraceae bacterium]